MANLLQRVKGMFKKNTIDVEIPMPEPVTPRASTDHTHEIRLLKSAHKDLVMQKAVCAYKDRFSLHDLECSQEETDTEFIYRWAVPPSPHCGCSHHFHVQDPIS